MSPAPSSVTPCPWCAQWMFSVGICRGGPQHRCRVRARHVEWRETALGPCGDGLANDFQITTHERNPRTPMHADSATQGVTLRGRQRRHRCARNQLMRKPLRKAKATARGTSGALYRPPTDLDPLATQPPSLISSTAEFLENRNDHHCVSTPQDVPRTENKPRHRSPPPRPPAFFCFRFRPPGPARSWARPPPLTERSTELGHAGGSPKGLADSPHHNCECTAPKPAGLTCDQGKEGIGERC